MLHSNRVRIVLNLNESLKPQYHRLLYCTVSCQVGPSWKCNCFKTDRRQLTVNFVKVPNSVEQCAHLKQFRFNRLSHRGAHAKEVPRKNQSCGQLHSGKLPMAVFVTRLENWGLMVKLFLKDNPLASPYQTWVSPMCQGTIPCASVAEKRYLT